MKIGVVGCAGRMGRLLVQTIMTTDGAELAGGTEQPGHAAVGADLGVLIDGRACGSRSATIPKRCLRRRRR